MIKKWTMIFLVSILLMGGVTSCAKVDCKHEYISDVISLSDDNIKFGVTEVNYIKDEDGDGYVDVLAVVDIKDMEKENSSRKIELGYKYENMYGDINYEELYEEIFTPTVVEDWRVWMHTNDRDHTQISIQDKVNLNLSKVKSIVVTIIENEYTFNEKRHEIEIPFEKVGVHEDFTVFNKDKFAEYYKTINKNNAKNQVFSVEMKELVLEGNDFIGQVEVKNETKQDIENLSVLINPIPNTGFGYYGDTDPKFDRTNGYLSLKSGESRVLDFKIDIEEAIKSLYGTKQFYKSSALREGEDIILGVCIRGMANDENMIFPDNSTGRYMYYFKDKLKVKEKVRTEEEEREFESNLNSDLSMVDYRLEQYNFERAREIIDKYLNETGKFKDRIDEYVKKIEDAEKAYKDEVEGVNGFSIFRPNRKLTQEEAMQLARYRVGDKLGDGYSIIEVDGRECLSAMYTWRQNGVAHIHVDLNTGEVNLNDGYFGWERYTKTEKEVQIGTGFGWESVEEKNEI